MREDIINIGVETLATYRMQCSANSPPSQLVIPEGMKLMPIYLLSAMKNPAFKLSMQSRKLDNKIYWIQKFLSMGFGKAPYLFYPRVYKVTDITNVAGNQYSYGNADLDWGFYADEDGTTMVKPKVLNANSECLTRNDAYVMDNGEYISMYITKGIPDEFAQ